MIWLLTRMVKSRLIGTFLIAFVSLLLLFNVGHGADELVFQDSTDQIVHVAMVTFRTLKDEHGFLPAAVGLRTKGEVVGIDDYEPIDPVPSSKTSVKHGPIQHGTPLIPYIPNPSPPDYPPSP